MNNRTSPGLRISLREWRIPLAGNKEELVKKWLIVYTDSLEEEIEATSFQCVRYTPPPSFEQLPSDGWTSDDFPLMSEGGVTDYLKARGGILELVSVCASVAICGKW